MSSEPLPPEPEPDEPEYVSAAQVAYAQRAGSGEKPRRPRDPTLTQCLAEGCTNPVRPPWDRRSGVLMHDYCSPTCQPAWLDGVQVSAGHEGEYRTRPTDVWLRSGSPTQMPWSDVPPLDEPEPTPEPERRGVHRDCTRCGQPVHVLHAAHGLCARCVVTVVHWKLNAAPGEPLPPVQPEAPGGETNRDADSWPPDARSGPNRGSPV